MKLRRSHGLSRREIRRIETAIGEAEAGHRGEICVHIDARYPGDGPISRARELFETLGVGETAQGTGALIYVATEDRRAAVWVDERLHGSRSPEFWSSVVTTMARTWASGRRGEAIAAAIRELGRLMATVAPGEDTRGDELPNKVTTQ